MSGAGTASETSLRIVILDAATLPPTVRLRPVSVPHDLVVHDRTSAEEAAERIRDADIVVTNKVPINALALAAAPRLRLVAVAATGFDMVDVPACRQRGIVVCNVRGYATTTVPEHCFALIFALRRNLLAYHRAVAEGRWQRSGQFAFFDFPIRDLAGSTLGIIGSGALGRATARIGHALGMQVLFAAAKNRSDQGSLYTPFPDVLARSDVISLHCPLNVNTRHLIGPHEFAQMKRQPLLINTGRGGLVDEQALCTALETGLISGAGFDVVTQEPPPPDHPFLRLMNRPDFILTPHIAWASAEAAQALADQLIDNIEAFLAGTPRNLIEPA